MPLAGSRQDIDWHEISAFQRRTADLIRRATGAEASASQASTRLAYLQKALLQAPRGEPELLAEVRGLDLRLKDLTEALSGDATRARLSESSAPSILELLMGIAQGHWNTTQGPTATHRASLEVAAKQFEQIRGQLDQLIDVDLPELEDRVEQTGAGWTPGR